MRTRFALLAVVAVSTLGGTLACSGDHSSPTEPKETATLTVDLAANCSGSVTAIDVTLDGTLYGTVKPGETREFAIPSGPHTLDVTTQGGSSSAVYHGTVNGSAYTRLGLTVRCSASGVSAELH